jgi:hypothetical protein
VALWHYLAHASRGGNSLLGSSGSIGRGAVPSEGSRGIGLQRGRIGQLHSSRRHPEETEVSAHGDALTSWGRLPWRIGYQPDPGPLGRVRGETSRPAGGWSSGDVRDVCRRMGYGSSGGGMDLFMAMRLSTEAAERCHDRAVSGRWHRRQVLFRRGMQETGGRDESPSGLKGAPQPSIRHPHPSASPPS